MRNIIGLVALVVSFAFAGTAFADGAAIFKAKCAACHGQKGEGMKGMAPAQKGNKFITEGKAEDIKKVVLLKAASVQQRCIKSFPLICPSQVYQMQMQQML